MKIETISVANSEKTQPQKNLPVYAAEDLTDGNRKAILTLRDQVYTLHITKQGKLLLTK